MFRLERPGTEPKINWPQRPLDKHSLTAGSVDDKSIPRRRWQFVFGFMQTLLVCCGEPLLHPPRLCEIFVSALGHGFKSKHTA